MVGDHSHALHWNHACGKSRKLHNRSRLDHVQGFSIHCASLLLHVDCCEPLEEIGWRGFAQTQMQRGHHALTGALVVGVLSAVWHIPLFLMSSGPMSMSQTPFWPWAVGVVPQAILLAWLYNRTGHSLAIVSVFHVLGNISGDVLHSSTAVVSALRIAAALVVLCLAGPRLGQPQAAAARSLETHYLGGRLSD